MFQLLLLGFLSCLEAWLRSREQGIIMPTELEMFLAIKNVELGLYYYLFRDLNVIEWGTSFLQTWASFRLF